MATGVFRSADAAERAASNRRAGNVATASAPRMTQYGPALRPGQGGINEVGSGGVAQGFYTGRPGTTLARALDPMVIWGSNQQAGAQSVVSPTIPGAGSGGGSQGGTGDGGGAGRGTPERYINPPRDTGAGSVWDQLLKALGEITTGARGQIGTAGDQLRLALTARDPEASFQWNPASVNIPQATLANYVQAVGGSPSEVQATRDLGQQFLNAFLGDVGQVAQGTEAASQAWRARQQDVGSQLQAQALRDLAFQEMAARLGVEQARAAEQRDIQNTALEMALKYAEAERNKRNLGVTAPSLPFDTVDIPGYGRITLPQTLG